MLPFRAAWTAVKTGVALIGEEFRRWFGLLLWGLILWALAKGAFAHARPALPYLLLAALLWLWVVLHSVQLTLANRLAAVRAREFYKQIDKKTSELGGKLKDARVVVLDGGADMLKALLRDAETDAQRDLGDIAAKAHAAVGDHIPAGRRRPLAQHYAGPPNPFRRLKRARRAAKGEG